MKNIKLFSVTILTLVLLFSIFKFENPANASDIVNNIKSDTTENMSLSVGQTYRFLVTSHSKINYTVGSGSVLNTFTYGKPHKNSDDTVTYYLGFKCVKEGDTGIYISTGSKPFRLFSVKVRDKIKISDALGTDPSKFSKVIIRYTYIKKPVTDKKRISSLLKDLSNLTLTKVPDGAPHKDGWTYALEFYPSNGGGTYQFVDTSGFTKKTDCKYNGPVGYYIPDDFNALYKILDDFYKNSN